MDNQNIIDDDKIKNELFKYLSFWKVFIISIFISIIISSLYLRYTSDVYQTNAKIEILDDAMDREMALPTAMTIFNRSTINLENEIQTLKSKKLIERVVYETQSYLYYKVVGNVISSIIAKSQFEEYCKCEIELKINPKQISKNYEYTLEFYENELILSSDEESKKIKFSENDRINPGDQYPFYILFSQSSELDNSTPNKFKVGIRPVQNTVESVLNSLNVEPAGKSSDILDLNYFSQNKKHSENILNNIVDVFDRDGISDRQLVFKRTIQFVDSRFDILKEELNSIEKIKEDYKLKNNVTILEADISDNLKQISSYDSEVLAKKTQLELIKIITNFINNDTDDFLPVNLGIDNTVLNDLIVQHNKILIEKNNILKYSGSKNPKVISLQSNLNASLQSIIVSLNNYKKQIEISLKSFENKEREFDSKYNEIPTSEKALREINRELEIKEALFLLLLQKREEAAINFAVTKPSIKVIDSAISEINPVSPNIIFTVTLSIIIGIVFPMSFLFLWFLFDNKIHTRENLNARLDDIPIVGEVPHIKDNFDIEKIINPKSRTPLAESLRMVIANLNFTMPKVNGKISNNSILVTSSVKGEGKTIISTNIASLFSTKYEKVLLIGADLRNPQIHKLVNMDKNIKGLSDIVSKNDMDYEKYIIKSQNIDIILSGTIPPNPTQMLSSPVFLNLLEKVKKNYDIVIIDSAPCILVSDTFEISNNVGMTLYVVRSNFSDVNLCNFINECHKDDKLNNINIVLNSVGNSQAYGYKYGYQYGYKYGYKYGYNYGYGYGYGSNNEK